MNEMNDLGKMQEEAVNSARAMYRRRTPQTPSDTAHISMTNSKHQTPTEPSAPPNEPQAPPTEPPRNEDAGVPPHEAPDKLGGFISSLLEDRERTLILIMIILLYEDNANIEMILALLYLISD